jgi:hypothetical protein
VLSHSSGLPHGEGGRYRDYRPLVALSPDAFSIKGMASFRTKFEFDESGDRAKVIGVYQQGAKDESPHAK